MSSLKRVGPYILIGALTAAIFIADIVTPVDWVVWFYYVIPIIIATRVFRNYILYIYASICTVLIFFGDVVSPPVPLPTADFLNRTLTIIVLWIIIFLSVRQRKADERTQVVRDKLLVEEASRNALEREKAVLNESIKLERQKADLYAMVTHDIKSPLTAIIGYAELIRTMKSDGLSDDVLEMVTSIYNNGNRLSALVDDFLVISKMESGQLAMSLSPADIRAILSDTVDEFRMAAGEKDISLKFDDGKELPKMDIDARMVRRAVSNLIQNAINYTPAGGDVTVSAESVPKGAGSFVAVSVSDTGPGIDPDERELVFDKYYRSPKSAGIKGTGLGLAIVAIVAEAHGGRVELQSEPGNGSTFSIILPVEAASVK